MATVKMIKGNKYADVFDSPETIEQAKKDGYELVSQSKKPVVESKTEVDEDSDEEDSETEVMTPSRGKRQ